MLDATRHTLLCMTRSRDYVAGHLGSVDACYNLTHSKQEHSISACHFYAQNAALCQIHYSYLPTRALTREVNLKLVMPCQWQFV